MTDFVGRIFRDLLAGAANGGALLAAGLKVTIGGILEANCGEVRAPACVATKGARVDWNGLLI